MWKAVTTALPSAVRFFCLGCDLRWAGASLEVKAACVGAVEQGYSLL